MRTTQHQRVYARMQIFEIGFGHHSRHVLIRPTFFGQRYKQRTGTFDHDGVTFDCRQRLGPVRHTGSITQIDKALVRQMLVQRAIDGQSTYAAVKDADGKLTIQMSLKEELSGKMKRPGASDIISSATWS